jgi:sortase B
MANKVMFGEIEDFSDKKIFDSHRYGSLYFDKKDHGIEFFAYIHTSAYNNAVFTANVKKGEQQIYLDGLLTNAIYKRDIGVTTEDHIILLSTCSSSSTNGRDILVGRIIAEVYEDPFLDTEINDRKNPSGKQKQHKIDLALPQKENCGNGDKVPWER